MKRITASLLVLILMFGAFSVVPVAAYHPSNGPWNDDEIGDGHLTVCFEPFTPVDTHSETILAGMNAWDAASDITFDDGTGLGCWTSFFYDIQVTWGPAYEDETLLTCSEAVARGGGPGFLGHGPVEFIWNDDCDPDEDIYWDLEDVNIPSGTSDAFEVAFHETGHILGLGHTSDGIECGPAFGTATAGNPQPCGVYWTFDTSDKEDTSSQYGSGPKWTSGLIYSGSLDPKVGNYSTGTRPTLAAGDYGVLATIRNASTSRNPNGVKIRLYQNTTQLWESPASGAGGCGTGCAADTFYYPITFSSQTTFRFEVPYSKAEILDVRIFNLDGPDGNQLMEEYLNCSVPGERITSMAADDAWGIQDIYPDLSLGGTFPESVVCGTP